MTGIFIQDEEETAEIVANGYYGADFKVNIFDQENGSYLGQNLNMTELIEPLNTSVNTTNVNNQVIGDKIIQLTSTTGLSVSDRVKVGNYIYKIIGILGDNITLNKGLFENVLGGSPVQNKGNLGIFKIDLTIADLGKYTLIGKDSIFGLHTTKMIKVVPKSLETMYKDIKNLEYAILGS